MIPKSLAHDQLPPTNAIAVQPGDNISLVTYKLPDNDKFACDYIYYHERLGKVLSVNEDGTFIAEIESISGEQSAPYAFTHERLNKVKFKFGQLAHVLYKL